VSRAWAPATISPTGRRRASFAGERRRSYGPFRPVPDESTLAFTATHPLVGADRIIWASDHPHPDATFPGVGAELERATRTLGARARERILGANARDLYRLPAVS
jgi:predicted TIM-barrel fold metal-dependent hydrolase